MAIYRSDQASVTFAAEGSPGAYPEQATIISAVGIGADNAAREVATTALAVGDTSITLNGTCAEDGLIGNSRFMIAVGGIDGEDGPHEVRKVVDGYGTSTITLDHPLAFAHAIGAAVVGLQFHDTNVDSLTVQTLSNPAYTAHNLITWLPGVYDAIDVPDPEQSFEPYYVLGGQNRNAYATYPGQETLAGSIGGMVLLNATPLRFPLGNMVTLPSTTAIFTGTGMSLLVGTAADTGPAADKGATVVRAYTSLARPVISAGTLVCFGSDDADDDTELGGAMASHSAFSILPKSTYEVRRLMRDSANGSSTTQTLYLDTPLQYAHKINEVVTTVTGSTYYHTIWEKAALDSITMNVSVLDSEETAANTWQRRYVGGKVGGMTIAAEEGGLVTVGWDSMLFLDMIHNMKAHSDLPQGATDLERFMPRYGPMSIINPTSVGKPTFHITEPKYVRPSTAPYYFSQGTIKWFGTNPSTGGDVLARLRSFSISVSNSEEPRYYLKKQQEGKRGPTEILEQRREYTMSATLAMDDSNPYSAGVANTARSVFKEMLLAGDYRGTRGLSGFAIELTFARSATDKIQIRIPGENFEYNSNMAGTSTVTGQVTSTGGEQGAFIRAATHNISDTNPIEAEVDITFRSMIINIQDSEPVYP